MTDATTPSACVDCGATICEHALRRLTGAQIVVNDPTPATEAQRMSAERTCLLCGYEFKTDEGIRMHIPAHGSAEVYEALRAEKAAAEQERDDLRAQEDEWVELGRLVAEKQKAEYQLRTQAEDRATRAEQALAEARVQVARLTAALESVGHVFRRGPNLCWCPESWSGPGTHTDACLIAFRLLAVASTPAGATESPAPAPDEVSMTAETRAVWCLACKCAHALGSCAPYYEPVAPDDGARGRYPGAHHEPNNPSCGCPGAVCTARRLTVIHDPAVSEMVSAYLDEPAPDQGAGSEA